METLQQLAYHVEDRLEEVEGASVFWSEKNELYTGIVEGLCELFLLIGRPTNTVNLPFSITPNQWLQQLPNTILALTDIQGPAGQIWKWTLRDQDYLQSGTASTDWENDCGPDQTIYRWWPMGYGQFGVWPSVPHAQTVTLTAISNPIVSGWPFAASQTVPIHTEFLQSLEKYGVAYARLKEGGAEFQEGVRLYGEFLSEMQRMTVIQNRVDPYIFGRGIGAGADRGQRPDAR